ncbi:MAG: hypothetical protein EPO61_08020 [Nitrospirae bacterium]|nr:MAG: hypothetical protein EPO61_08020 [Nitrospirota bacterium]
MSELIYHPNRYAYCRPFIKTLLSIYKQNAGTGTPTMEALNAIGDSYMQLYNTAVQKMPFEQRPMNTGFMSKEVSLFMHFARFEANGRNIFHFQPALTSLLRKTDVDDVLLHTIRLPYDCFHMTFEKQPDLNLWGQGYFVDGAYISTVSSRTANILQILLTTLRTDLDYSTKPNFILHPDRYYYFSLDLIPKETNVKTAIERSLKEHQPFSPKDIPDTTGTYRVEGKTISLIDRGKLSQIEVAEENRLGFPIFLEAIKLVINGLCYLSSQHKQVNTRFPESVPTALLQKLQATKRPTEISRTTRKLASMGYTRIHFCGDEIQREANCLPTGQELPTHWRRGHWRNQAFGERFSEHKLLWIKPTMVRKDKGEPSQGHIYEVESADN